MKEFKVVLMCENDIFGVFEDDLFWDKTEKSEENLRLQMASCLEARTEIDVIVTLAIERALNLSMPS